MGPVTFPSENRWFPRVGLNSIFLLTVAFVGSFLLLASSAPADAATTFDDIVTPDVIFGSGNANGGWTVDREGSVELGLRAKQRFPVPANVFNSNGDGTYTFPAGAGAGPSDPVWNFEWSVNSDYDGGSGDKLTNFTYLLEIDYDSGPGTNFLAWDHISSPTQPIPWATPVDPTFYDHAIGTNATANGGGTAASDPASYAALLGANNVAQNSWRHSFFNQAPFDGFDPNDTGAYNIRLTALNGATVVAQVSIQVQVESDITPDVIFGSGNAQGGWTIDREGSVELGLRTKQRFPVPANVFNSNGDGTYTFPAGAGAGPSDPVWNFEWSVNSDYDGGSGDKLTNFTYLLEIDYDSGPGTNFLAWDHISSPTQPIPWATPVDPTFYDHAIGTNATANGGGTVASDPASYAALLGANNVAQNSWRHSFFNQPPFDGFDPTKAGLYDIRLTAFTGAAVAAKVAIQVQVTCATDTECDDGIACNGAETCDVGTGTCVAGTVADCSSLSDQCNVGTCVEPSGACVASPLADGSACDTGDTCSVPDSCQTGACMAGGGGDSEADGICDLDDNCPSDVNPGQSDVDGDGIGDVCDPVDGPFSMVLSLVKLNAAKAGAATPRGKVSLRLLVQDDPSGNLLPNDLTVNGDVRFEVSAGSFAATVSMGACIQKNARLIACLNGNTKAKFKLLPQGGNIFPNTYKVTVRLKKHTDTNAPTGPVTVSLRQPTTSIDRSDDISACTAKPGRLRCREQ